MKYSLTAVAVAFLFATTLSATEPAATEPTATEPAATEPTWKLKVGLIDGSEIIGVPDVESVKLKLGFDDLTVPYTRVKQIEWKEDRDLVRMELINRDVFTGDMVADSINLRTLFGQVKIDENHVDSIHVISSQKLNWLPSTNGLVLYYSFDDLNDSQAKTTVVTNQAANSHDGKAKNLRWLENGVRGGAIEFDRTGLIEIPHHADLCPAALTMGMWVCPGENSSGYQLLAAKTDSSSWQNGYGFVGSSGNSGHLRFFVNGYSTHMAAATVPVGEWTHLVGVFDGKSVRTYLNGKFMHVHKMTSMDPFGDSPFLSDSPLASIKHSNRSLCLGGESSGYSWRGKMDEFVLYNRALSDKEISWLYASVEE